MSAAELLEQARKHRDSARRARRLGRGLSRDDDRELLKRHADELDIQASKLERQAAALASPSPLPTQGNVEHQRQREQQQQESNTPPENRSEPPSKSN